MDTLSQPGSDWKPHKLPLPRDEIAEARDRIGRALPQRLVDLYRECNGGEGSLPFQPWRFVLWGIDEVADLREHEHYQTYNDQFVFFGGNGAGEYFGINQKGQVIFLDPIAGEDSIIVVAESFDEFATNIGSEPPSN